MVVPLVGIQKKDQGILNLLKVSNKVLDLIQEWGVKYRDVPKWLVKKEKIVIEMDNIVETPYS